MKSVNLNTHYNQNLPPVDIKLEVWHNDAWTVATRKVWASSRSGNIEFRDSKDKVFFIPSNKIKWRYP